MTLLMPVFVLASVCTTQAPQEVHHDFVVNDGRMIQLLTYRGRYVVRTRVLTDGSLSEYPLERTDQLALDVLVLEPSGALVAGGSDDGGVRLFSAQDGSAHVMSSGAPPDHNLLLHHGSSVSALDFSDDGSLLAVGFDDGYLTVYRTADGAFLRPPARIHDAAIATLAIDPKNLFVLSLDSNADAQTTSLSATAVEPTNGHRSKRLAPALDRPPVEDRRSLPLTDFLDLAVEGSTILLGRWYDPDDPWVSRPEPRVYKAPFHKSGAVRETGALALPAARYQTGVIGVRFAPDGEVSGRYVTYQAVDDQTGAVIAERKDDLADQSASPLSFALRDATSVRLRVVGQSSSFNGLYLEVDDSLYLNYLEQLIVDSNGSGSSSFTELLSSRRVQLFSVCFLPSEGETIRTAAGVEWHEDACGNLETGDSLPAVTIRPVDYLRQIAALCEASSKTREAVLRHVSRIRGGGDR